MNKIGNHNNRASTWFQCPDQLKESMQPLTDGEVPGGDDDVVLAVVLAWEQGEGGGVGDGLGGAGGSRALALAVPVVVVGAARLPLLALQVWTGGPRGAGTGAVAAIVVKRPAFLLEVCDQLQR